MEITIFNIPQKKNYTNLYLSYTNGGFLSFSSPLNREYVSAILFLSLEACRKFANLSHKTTHQEVFQHPDIQKFKNDLLKKLGKKSTGSSTKIVKAVIAIEPPFCHHL